MNQERKLILASGSPRRKELLEQAGYTFDVITSNAEEITASESEPSDVAMQNACLKAQAVAHNQAANATVIGADTIVVLGDRIFGKPANPQDAIDMLHELSGQTHQVITGVCIVQDGKTSSFAESTDVTFKKLSNDEITSYVATGEPLDKAGAYGIQDIGGSLVEHIEGDYNNVVGLPMDRLQRALNFES